MFSHFISIFTMSVMLAGGSKDSDAINSRVVDMLVNMQSQLSLLSFGLRTEERLATLEASVKSLSEKIGELEPTKDPLQSEEMGELRATLSRLSDHMEVMGDQQVLRDDFTTLVQVVNESRADITYIRTELEGLPEAMATRCITPNDPVITEGVECPEPYEKVGPDCLSLDLSKHVTWAASRTLCQETAAGAGGRGDIAVPRDNDALEKFMSKFKSDFYWLGATDEVDESEWKWLNGETLDASFEWANDEPDNTRDQNYMCIKVKSGKLEYHDCYNTVDSPPVCQYFSK